MTKTIIFVIMKTSKKIFNSRISEIGQCRLIEMPKIHNPAGNITVIDGKMNLPFETKRVYYLYDVPGGECRGGHAHKELYQLIIAASGSFDVVLDDGKNKNTFNLNQPFIGLLVIPGIWRELQNFSSGSICLVLASHVYDENDYIRDYKNFMDLKNE